MMDNFLKLKLNHLDLKMKVIAVFWMQQEIKQKHLVVMEVKPLMVVKLHLNLIKKLENHLDLKLKQIHNKVVVLKVVIKRKRNKLTIKQNKVKQAVQQLQQITLLVLLKITLIV